MKSMAMSLPDPLCAVPLAPGTVETRDASDDGGNDIVRWVNVAGPSILRIDRKDKGRCLSVKGFYSLWDRQSWIIQDGTGLPTNSPAMTDSMK